MTKDTHSINKKLNLLWIVLLLMLVENFASLFVTLSDRGYIEIKVNNAVNKSVSTEVEKKINSLDFNNNIENTINNVVNSIDIESVIKNEVSNQISKIKVINGIDGKDSISTNTTIIEKTIEQVPVNGLNGIDGLTPIIRCNTDKNRWEYRYNIDDNWRVLNGEQVKCTIEE